MKLLDNIFSLAKISDFITKGFFSEAKSTLEELNFNEMSKDEKLQFTIIEGIISYELGDFESAESLFNSIKGFSEDEIDNNKELFFKGLIFKAMAMIRTSRVDEAVVSLNAILPDVIQTKNEQLESLIYNWLGNSYWLQGILQEALNYHELALKIRNEIGTIEEIATSYNNIGIIYRVQGRLKKSIEILNKAIDLNIDSIKIKSYALSNRGLNYFELGDYKNALKDHIESFHLRKTTGSSYLISDSIFNVIRTAYILKDVDLLFEFFEKLNEISDYPSLRSIRLMASAYTKMLTDRESTLVDWNKALKDQSLEFGYKLICYEEMLDIYSSQNLFKFDNVLELLENFEKMAKINKLYSSLIKIFFVKGLIFKNMFEIEKAEFYFSEVISLAKIHHLPFHEQLAFSELTNLEDKMEKFQTIYSTQKGIELQFDYSDIISYIRNFEFILSEKFES